MVNIGLVSRRLSLGLAVAIVLFLSGALLAAQQQVSPTLTITVNKSTVFRLAERAKRVSVSQPDIADVIVVAPSQLLINGKAVGTTSLIVFDEKGEVSNYDLIVTPDVEALRAQLRVVFPNEKVEVATSGPAIVLKGEVSNEVVYDKVLEIATTYLPPKPPAAVAPTTTATTSISTQKTTFPTSGSAFAGGGQIAFDDTTDLVGVDRFPGRGKLDGIVDLLVIKEVRQIELDVIVAEVGMDKLRDIGFDFAYSNPARRLSSVTSSIGEVVTGITGTGSFTFVSGTASLLTLYRMLQNKDITEILAQPRLVMKNGRSGGFLAGGEIPVVTILGDNQSIEFKPFGVRLDFVPTITWSDRIDLRVFPEVSEPDFSLAVAGVPGLRVRRTLNRVEMKEGESLIIGGLLDRRIAKSLDKIPLLGDIPILGALFRSTRFSNRESELVFVITPRVVRAMKPGEKAQLPGLDKYDDPDIRQIPLPGSPEMKKGSGRGATIP